MERDKTMTNTKGISLKNKQLRHAEYYDMTETFDELHAMSVAKSNFKNLMKFIIDDNNIFLAYRNIKKNKGSATAGYDGVTIKDIEKLACGDFLTIIKRRFKDYRPRKVKRVEIPKPNGKLRPLGIPSIWDRIVQQCILQILEPICEAKFNKHSYGFRPNCSTENAIADCLARINQSKMNYVVDIDIKGFFDEVNHTKLMRQIWTMGIRDKQLLVIIRKMLKAPIVMRNGNVVFPTKGTPQGGILSTLLANICLNEFDWWIANQWEERTVKELKHHYRKNGAWDKGNIYSKLRSHTSLKEMYLVRCADDFKIFCRTGEEAQRAFYATQKWLRERLKLPISMEKSKVTNLNKAESEFLGFSIRLHKKGKKKVAFTYVCRKAEENIKNKLKQQIKKIQYAGAKKNRHRAIGDYNMMVIGIHNYYRIASHCSVNFTEIYRSVRTVIEARLKARGMTKNGIYGQDHEGYRPYLKSKQMRYIEGFPILPIGYIKKRTPLNKRRNLNKYTKEGRKLIHQEQQAIESWKIKYLVKGFSNNKKYTVEFSDNKISKFISQKGKCAITGNELLMEEIECHHINPYHLSKDDSYKNLVIISREIHRLIHATSEETILKLLRLLKLNHYQIRKLNTYRKKAANFPISIKMN